MFVISNPEQKAFLKISAIGLTLLLLSGCTTTKPKAKTSGVIKHPTVTTEKYVTKPKEYSVDAAKKEDDKTADSKPENKPYGQVKTSGVTRHATVTTEKYVLQPKEYNLDASAVKKDDDKAEDSKKRPYGPLKTSGVTKHPTVVAEKYVMKPKLYTAQELTVDGKEVTTAATPSFGEATREDKVPPAIVVSSPTSLVLKEVLKDETINLKGSIIDPSGIYKVKINDTLVKLDQEEGFHAQLLLNKGENRVYISAVDNQGNESVRTLNITREGKSSIQMKQARVKDLNTAEALAKSRLPKTPEFSNPAEKSFSEKSQPDANRQPSDIRPQNWYSNQYALVVGIDSYQNPGIETLKNAVTDAETVSAMFKKMGYRVIEIYNENATKNAIINAFAKIEKTVTSNDGFVFYFAGHGQGVTLENQEKIGYISPYDSRIDAGDMSVITLDREAIALNDINKYSKGMKAKHVALLLDSCFSGLAMSRNILPIRRNADTQYYSDLLNRKAINILTAGDGQPVSDGSGHSPFTKALIYGLEKGGVDLDDGDSYVTFSQLAVYVKEKVEKATQRRQRPQFDNLIMDDGDFIFQINKPKL